MLKREAPSVRFWLAVGLLLSAMGTVQILSARRESQTYDEAFELGAGYNYLKTGVLRFNLEQPPVGKVVSGLPLLFLQPASLADHPNWKNLGDVEFGREFFYRNRLPADEILFAGRLGTIALTLLFGFVLALWSRAKFGGPASLLALTLFAFDPNLIAHGRYATTDLAAAAFIFFACIAWTAYLEAPDKWRLTWAGVMLGLALATKFSALMLIPAFLCLHGIRWRQRPSLFRPIKFVATWLALALLAYVTIAIIHAPQAKLFLPAATKLGFTVLDGAPTQVFYYRNSLPGELLFQVSQMLGLAPNSYLAGLNDFFRHNALGHPSYLLGAFSSMGWWYYFPIVFLVKTPTAVFVALALLLVFTIRCGVRPSLRALPLEWFSVLLPPAFIFGASMASHINLGVRHILPVYPFLYIAIGAGLFRVLPAVPSPAAKLAPAAICCLLIVESGLTFPNYLSFFNILCGGVNAGPKYLLDSNIDWGQDLKKLRAALKPYGETAVCLEYFGTADLAYYGLISHEPFPIASDKDGRERADCIAAVSVNLLYGLYGGPDRFSWVRSQKPLEKIGGSIYLYDLRKKRRAVP